MYQPAIVIGGYAGWKVFERTLDRQRDAFAAQTTVKQSLAYFRDKIGDISNAGDLVADRRLLAVVLGAFGLEDEIGKKALIRRVLEEGADDPRSFANRLNDPRWKSFAAAFGFGDIGGVPTWSSAFKEAIGAKYVERSFERAVGDVDPSFRLAMNFRREARAIAEGANADRVGWLQIMGQRPLRAVAEAALGLPTSIAQLNVDRQRAMFEAKSEQVFGEKSVRAFRDEANVEAAIRRYFVVDAARSSQANAAPGSAALTLLGGSALSAGAAIGLILSNASSR